MKLVDIDNLEPGQLLGRTLFSENGTVLLSAGVQLTVFMISTLRRLGVPMVYISEPGEQQIPLDEVLTEQTKQAVISQMSATFNALRSGKEFSARAISMSVDQLMEDVLRNQNVLVQLSDIRTADNALYMHSMNVCMMATMVGVNMGLNMLQLKELAIGALLHDIGKLGATGPEEGRSHHAWRGFELLKLKREYSLLTAHVAFQHHEAPDGSGQPRGLSGEEIHAYAKITAVANMYDNLVHGTAELPRLQPHEAIERLHALSDTALDREILIEFLKIVSVYPNGVSVRLSNRLIGIVVAQHRGLPSRPIVRVIAREGESSAARELDLARLPTLFIDAVIN
ncbi:HD-GYP domain, c-di-GMP phosphodiesterase class II (or its inactivated variant) [Cohnella sp. OV330]|uniref:HD-GYP domain-containing protein n=1 Tax=Cohnella sp. OV330 TaxID=1855288 RepID=UPI0008E717FC|nr:HD domain-containing phosphohydrolase [Cohnella sp. OV330]SFA80226.1 HD-GYP domain, c-di-GMP phosphodiesterase class II (or its inactivated variant) [Cohnella sp. OV330]